MSSSATAANYSETNNMSIRYYSIEVFEQAQTHSLFLSLSKLWWDDNSSRLVRGAGPTYGLYVLSEARRYNIINFTTLRYYG